MRFIPKLLLAAALLLPVGAFAATTQLDVNITVSITATVDVVWWDGAAESTAAQTWNIGAVALNSDNDSAAALYNIRSKTTGVDLKLSAQVSTAGSWTLVTQTAYAGTQNQYYITASTTAPVASLELTAAAQTFVAVLPAATPTTTGFKLLFHTPATVSTVNPGTITVRLTAAAN